MCAAGVERSTLHRCGLTGLEGSSLVQPGCRYLLLSAALKATSFIAHHVSDFGQRYFGIPDFGRDASLSLLSAISGMGLVPEMNRAPFDLPEASS
ncbi:hypothetical protein C5167_041900 [Papaver somniferum]|nr:hypothetical protein C5167_041900 [Papaver somniferum]